MPKITFAKLVVKKARRETSSVQQEGKAAYIHPTWARSADLSPGSPLAGRVKL